MLDRIPVENDADGVPRHFSSHESVTFLVLKVHYILSSLRQMKKEDMNFLRVKSWDDLRHNLRRASLVCQTICYTYRDEVLSAPTKESDPRFLARKTYNVIQGWREKIISGSSPKEQQKIMWQSLTEVCASIKNLHHSLEIAGASKLPGDFMISIDIISLVSFTNIFQSGDTDRLILFCKKHKFSTELTNRLIRAAAFEQLRSLCTAFDLPGAACPHGSSSLALLKMEETIQRYEHFTSRIQPIVEKVREQLAGRRQ